MRESQLYILGHSRQVSPNKYTDTVPARGRGKGGGELSQLYILGHSWQVSPNKYTDVAPVRPGDLEPNITESYQYRTTFVHYICKMRHDTQMSKVLPCDLNPETKSTYHLSELPGCLSYRRKGILTEPVLELAPRLVLWLDEKLVLWSSLYTTVSCRQILILAQFASLYWELHFFLHLIFFTIHCFSSAIDSFAIILR